MQIFGFTFQEFHSGVPFVFVAAANLTEAVAGYQSFAEKVRAEHDPEFIGPDTPGVAHEVRVAGEIGQDGSVKLYGPFTEENLLGQVDDMLANFTYADGKAVLL